MPSSTHLPAIQGLEVEISVIRGKDLVAKDSSGVFGKKKSSDPYVKIFFGGKNHGKTTSFSTYNIRLKLASLTTFKTTAAIDSGATPCFQIYFGDVGGLLEHRDILQNSSETANASTCSLLT